MRPKASFVIEKVKELPDIFKEGVMYVIYWEDNKFWMAAYLCPCGCGNKTQLPINGFDDKHNWNFTEQNGLPTLSPSILKSDPEGCMSHYFIVKGQVIWC